MKLIISALLTAVAWAAVPTVGTPTVVSGTLTSQSVQLTYTISAGNWYCWAEYDTNTGAPYTYAIPADGIIRDGTCYVSLVNLQPNTQYFVRASAYPTYNSTTDIGYATEMNFTTTAPAAPIPTLPTAYAPSYPDTTGYTPVTASPSGSGADNCGLQAKINAATYGTVIEIPQGAQCIVPAGGSGWTLPALAVQAGKSGIDDPTHQWIIIRTARTPALLPPDGTRTGPDYAGVAAKLYIPNRDASNGALFASQAGLSDSAHHWWIDNVQAEWNNDVVAGATNPQPYASLVWFNANTTATGICRYCVLDRILGVAPDAPFRAGGATILDVGGQNIAVMNSYIANTGMWQPFVNSIPDSTRVSNTITQTAGTWQRRTDEAAWTIGSTVSAVLTASGGYSGSYVMYLTASGVFLDYTTPTGGETASWACTNCTATAVASPTIAATARAIATGTITGGNIATFADAYSAYAGGEGSNVLTISNGPGPFYIHNNYLSAPQNPFYVESANARPDQIADVTFTRNTVVIPPSTQSTSPESNTWFYTNRSAWEIKTGRRFLVEGNYFSGNYGDRTPFCSAIVWRASPRIATTTDAGISDQTVRNNTIQSSCSVFYLSGLSADSGISGQRPTLTRNILIQNNLMNDINGLSYTEQLNDVASGNLGAWITNGLGFQGLTLVGNSMRQNRGTYPSLDFSYGSSSGLTMQRNVLSMAAGSSLSLTAFTANATISQSAFTPNPYVVNGGSNFVTTLNGSTGGYAVTSNILIGALKRSGTYPATAELTGANMTTIASTYPTGNTFVAGDTEAARESTAGMLSNGTLAASSPYRGYGANIAAITAASGTPTSMAVSTTTTTATVTFRAPVAAERCSLAWSTDGSTWPVGNLATSTGSDRAQTVTATGLTTKTPYYLRLICATQTLPYLVRTK